MEAIVNGIPLVAVVMAVVEYVKKFGVEGKALLAVSMAVGLALGVAYQVSIAVPVGFSGWFSACLYGLALGLTASGLYDAGRSMTKQG